MTTQASLQLHLSVQHCWVVDDSDSECVSLDIDEDDYMFPINFDLDGEKCTIVESQAKLTLKSSSDMTLLINSDDAVMLPLQPRKSSTMEIKAASHHANQLSEAPPSSQETKDTNNTSNTSTEKTSGNLLKFENWVNFEASHRDIESEP